MTQSPWRSHRAPSALLLVLVLGLTTGWTPAGATTRVHERSVAVTTAPVDSVAMSHRVATARQAAFAIASRATGLKAHRASEVVLAVSARTLFQARVAASRAHPAAAAKAKAPAVKAKAKAPVAKAPVAKATTTRYVGKNHFWWPAFGISRAVVLFPCSRTRAPDDYLYRWGCAGRNNVYLLGHASSVLRRLHDGYLAGRLHVGMLAVYADGNGRVRTYRVTTWRVVDPMNSEWAIASQRVPSMTIQTCIGIKRLNIRLVAIN
jgi:hypothetical protein